MSKPKAVATTREAVGLLDIRREDAGQRLQGVEQGLHPAAQRRRGAVVDHAVVEIGEGEQVGQVRDEIQRGDEVRTIRIVTQ